MQVLQEEASIAVEAVPENYAALLNTEAALRSVPIRGGTALLVAS
jgi:hypothetical protein